MLDFVVLVLDLCLAGAGDRISLSSVSSVLLLSLSLVESESLVDSSSDSCNDCCNESNFVFFAPPLLLPLLSFLRFRPLTLPFPLGLATEAMPVVLLMRMAADGVEADGTTTPPLLMFTTFSSLS